MSEDTTITDAKQKIVQVLIDMGAETYRWEDVKLNDVADRILQALIKQIVLDLVARPELERAVVLGGYQILLKIKRYD